MKHGRIYTVNIARAPALGWLLSEKPILTHAPKRRTLSDDTTRSTLAGARFAS